MPQPFVFPNPRDDSFHPSDDDGYPYNRMTRTEDIEAKPSGFKGVWCEATFPRPYIPARELLANVDATQKSMILAKPEEYIPLTVFGGGAFYRQYETFKESHLILQQWLRDAEFPDEQSKNLKVHVLAAERKVYSAFELPNTIILEGATPDVRKWIENIAVLSLASPGATFFAHSFDKENVSWVVMNLQAGTNSQVVDDPVFMKEVLAVVLETLWKNKGVLGWFKKFIQTRSSDPQLMGKTVEQVLYDVTKTYRITYITSGNAQKKIEARYQIHGRQPTDNPKELHFLAESLRKIVFNVGFSQYSVDKRIIKCVWCGQSNHARFTCPYPQIPGFLGMNDDEMKKFFDEAMRWDQSAASQKEKEKARKARGEKDPLPDDGFSLVRGTSFRANFRTNFGRGNTPRGLRGSNNYRGNYRGGYHGGNDNSFRGGGYRGYSRGEYRGSSCGPHRGGGYSRGGRQSNPQYEDYYFVEGDEY
ncbi:hypothetical protein E1B28_010776 [Marasmius oreades]|uniref:Uncharacterized protein n=1 Tax=Marasmius oreades TaxID=181124 RepID=A0A9P7RSN8_9AGAR|nr:uncharacterized protein E1B28_010776 [Marasmius oreades]KAG7089066.1 hypothetical protein E1B28_010776 [Marasmius oreades]